MPQREQGGRAGLVDPRRAARRADKNRCKRAQAQLFLAFLLAPLRLRCCLVVDSTIGLAIGGGAMPVRGKSCYRLGGMLVEDGNRNRAVSNSFHFVPLVVRCVLVRFSCRLRMPVALRSRATKLGIKAQSLNRNFGNKYAWPHSHYLVQQDNGMSRWEKMQLK